MSEEVNTIQWVPVIGTLGGALLGFLASFLTAFFTKSRESKEQREERDRRRIERIYELLIIVSHQNGQHLGNAINWIHNARPISHDENKGIPPLVELEMLVSLYFSELENTRQRLMEAIQRFGMFYLQIQHKDFHRKDKVHQQKIADKFSTMNEDINNRIQDFKERLSEMAKS